MFFEGTMGAVLNIQYPALSTQHLSVYGKQFTHNWDNG